MLFTPQEHHKAVSSSFLLHFEEQLFLHTWNSHSQLKTRFISNVFATHRLPHQIFTRGKMNNAIKTDQAAHICNYELNVTFRRQVVATVEISTFNNYRTVYLQRLFKPDLRNTKRFYKLNRQQLQNLIPLCRNEVLVKKLGYKLLKTMIILTIEFWWGR